MAGRIYCGDNLEVLSLPEFFQPEMVDLVYADPPFNSKRTFNIVYRGSSAQQEAFKDYWTWTEAAPMYARLMGDSTLLPRSMKPMLEALHDRLVEDDDDLLAYLTMMIPRLVAAHRVLDAEALIPHAARIAAWLRRCAPGRGGRNTITPHGMLARLVILTDGRDPDVSRRELKNLSNDIDRRKNARLK